MLAEIEARLADRTRQAVRGALARSSRTGRPRPADIDWPRTIHANLRHWLPEHRTVVPERLVGYGRHQRSLARDVIIAVDQSGSMAGSVVHASLFACVLSRLPTLRTSMIAFDTAVADLTPLLADPVDVLFGVQLGGGTDIGGALGYCRSLVTRPQDTVLILVSDLFEGGSAGVMRARVAELVRDGVTVLVLLALSDDGVPAHDHHEAEALAALGATVTSCTPDEFPDVLARQRPARWTTDRSPVRKDAEVARCGASRTDAESESSRGAASCGADLEVAEGALGVDAGVLGEAEHALADDVAHDLVAAAGDAPAGRAEQELGPGVGAPLAGVGGDLGAEDAGHEVGQAAGLLRCWPAWRCSSRGRGAGRSGCGPCARWFV